MQNAVDNPLVCPQSPVFSLCMDNTFRFLYTAVWKNSPDVLHNPEKMEISVFCCKPYFFIRRKSTAHKSYTQGYQQLVDNFPKRGVEIVE